MKKLKKLLKTAGPIPSEVKSKGALIRLDDLAPKQDLRGGRRVVFGQAQVETRTNKK